MSTADQGDGQAPNGQLYWLAYLAGFVPVPFLNSLLIVIVEVALRPRAKLDGGIAEANSRHALNWALTWFLVFVPAPLIPAIFVPILGNPPPGWVTALALTFLGLWVLGGVVTLVYLILGATRARTQEVRCPLAIPFLRPPSRP